MTANKQVSRDAVVHGCFSEGGDFILNIFYWESKRHLSENFASETARQLTSFSC